jgi:GMP synthase (glutamine-hydrolysing)
MRCVVVQHETELGLGLLAHPLHERGFRLVERFRTITHGDVEADLLVLLSGSMRLSEAEAHPFLDDERAVVAERLALGRPTLGIGLGAQVLALAAGSTVSPGKNGVELGVGPLRWTVAGQADTVLQPPNRSVVTHWHDDTFAPVPDAVLLASTDRYTQQAFRIGTSFGFQFHVEFDVAAFERWVASQHVVLTAAKREVATILAGAGKLKAAEGANRSLCERLIRHFGPA